MKTCSRHPFSVSSSSCEGVTTATPTRHFAGTYKYQPCDLYGQTYRTIDEASAAMDERGYTEPYYSRSSVPLAGFAKLDFHLEQARFDALYRLYKWAIRNGDCYFPRNRVGTPLQAMRAKLRNIAKKIGIFHPVARVYCSPRFLEMKRVRGRYVGCGRKEASLLGSEPLKLGLTMVASPLGIVADCSID